MAARMCVDVDRLNNLRASFAYTYIYIISYMYRGFDCRVGSVEQTQDNTGEEEK